MTPIDQKKMIDAITAFLDFFPESEINANPDFSNPDTQKYINEITKLSIEGHSIHISTLREAINHVSSEAKKEKLNLSLMSDFFDALLDEIYKLKVSLKNQNIKK